MTKSNKLILVAAVLILSSIIVIILNDMTYSLLALVLKLTGLALFMNALYVQIKERKSK